MQFYVGNHAMQTTAKPVAVTTGTSIKTIDKQSLFGYNHGRHVLMQNRGRYEYHLEDAV